MFLIKTKLKQSPIHGIGVFADQFVPRGTKTWELDARFDHIMSKEDVNALSQYGREEMAIHAYLDVKTDVYVLCSDNAKFMNHSTSPTIDSFGEYDIAVRDIQPGEELTCDYSIFDAEFDAKLYK